MAPGDALQAAINANDAAAVARVLEVHPELKARLDEPAPGGAFGQTALLAAVERENRDMVDVLLRAGADINQKSHWWAGGFHVLDDAWRTPWMASFLIGRGAIPEIHHVVRLEMLEDARRMLADDPALIHARGGDGQTPLHFAQTVEMAEFLILRGADIDARDVDHESTAAQWMVRDRQDVARELMTRGATTDILMASALGDLEAVARLLDGEPDVVATTVSERWFPKVDPRAGGTIYIWTLGADKSAHEIAREFGHEDVFGLLMTRTPADLKLSIACELGDEPLVRQLVASRPGGATVAPSVAEHRRIAAAARNNNAAAVKLMLEAGWAVDVRGHENATPLHWAGFHGNVDMARALIAHGATVDVRGDIHDGTPLQWTIYGSVHGWHCKTGDYAGTAEVLLAAGAQAPPVTGDTQASPAVLEALRRHGSRAR